MRRILLISTSGIKSDGITSWMRQTVDAMNRSGLMFETVAWQDADSRVIAEVENCGIKVNLVPNRQKDLLRYCGALLRLIRGEKYDIVHVCGSSGLTGIELLLSRISGIPMRICHSHNTNCQHKTLDKILRPVMYSCATDFLACGTDAGKWLFGDQPFTIIPNGKNLDLLRFDNDARQLLRSELGIDDDQVVIGHIGRFNEQKNHIKLLDAFAELRKRSDRYLLVLVGDGALLDDTRGRAKELGLEDTVLFLGFRSDVPRLLNAMDCMVLPSLYEGFPNVVVEWQVNGLPCVISDTITRECAVTPQVRFESLAEPASGWADAIEAALSVSDRARDGASSPRMVADAGYEIRRNAQTLREFYLKGVSR